MGTPLFTGTVEDKEELSHDDGRQWAVRLTEAGYQIRLRLPESDEPVLRNRHAVDAAKEIDALVAAQLADGWHLPRS